MSTSASVRAAYQEALNGAFEELKTLLSQHKSAAWKPVPSNEVSLALSSDKSSTGSQLSDVAVHRKASKGADIVRATAEFQPACSLDDIRSVLSTPQVRPAWDKLVERASVLEFLGDSSALITKTDYRLGWPASPRDAVTIAKTFGDASSVIHIATSLPRSSDEPSFLRPSPPYVRSHVHLFAICIQLPNSNHPARIQLFQSWATLCLCCLALAEASEMSNAAYRGTDEALHLEYAVVHPDSVDLAEETAQKNPDELAAFKERRRLERAVEVSLSQAHGWHIQVSVQVSSELSSSRGSLADSSAEKKQPWIAAAEQTRGSSRSTWRITHDPVDDADALVRVRLIFRRLAGGKKITVNKTPCPVLDIESRDPAFYTQKMLDDAEAATAPETGSAMGISEAQTTEASIRSSRANEVATLIRRSYTYFASLLQEPEAKWRHVTETRGVAVSQLNSIDPTVTIFRAVSTFVGVGVWDLYGTVTSPGARLYWDKSLEEMSLLDDVDELSSLWVCRFKAVWPAWPRDSVLLRTSYKSPTSVHIFAFSVDDDQIFPSMPACPPNHIRTNTVIQGWSIEALSPTTTQVTLIEQTNNKGWSNKSWTYQQMISSVAGVGDFSIKFGSPPVVTRLLGAKATAANYNHEKNSFKLEYKPTHLKSVIASAADGKENAAPSQALQAKKADNAQAIECELRCDVDIWASSLDIVTDPPPSRVSVLSRHRLATGGGCWVTIEHDSALTKANDAFMILVRKGAATRAKGSVYINGAKAAVDSESMANDQVKVLTTQKRVRASPMPLDQWSAGKGTPRSGSPRPPEKETPEPSPTRIQPQMSFVGSHELQTLRPPLSHALEALALLQAFHAAQGPDLSSPVPGWTTMSEKAGYTRRRIVTSLSTTNPILRGDKIVENLTAEQLLAHISNPASRLKWDSKLESYQTLASYGDGCSTGYFVTKPAFLTFRSRLFNVASISSHIRIPSASSTSSTSTVYLYCSCSAPFADEFPASKLNPQVYPLGQVLLEGWILETIDPYASDTYAIPSTRVTYFSCLDWGGAVPQALGTMLNPSPLKVIDAVAAQARLHSPPRLQIPASSVQIEGPLHNDSANQCEWILVPTPKQREPDLVQSGFTADSLSAQFVLALPEFPASMFGNKTHTRNNSSPAAVGKAIRPPALRTTPSMATLQKFRLEAVSEALNEQRKEVSTKTAVANASPATAPSSPSKSKTRGSGDYVVAELILGKAALSQGCAITTSTRRFPFHDSVFHFDDIDGDALELPYRATLHELPADGASATISEMSRDHLLRITLPLGQYINPVADPLRDENQRPPPEWVQSLQTGRTVISLQVGPAATAPEPSALPSASSVRVYFNQSRLQPVPPRDSRPIFEQHADEDWSFHAAHLSRVPKRTPTKGSSGESNEPDLPLRLRTPLAIASRVRTEPVASAEASSPKTEDVVVASKPPLGSAHSSGQLTPIGPGAANGKQAASTNAEALLRDRDSTSTLTNVLGNYPFALASQALQTQAQITKPLFSLRFLVMVAIISFLLGSLLRSLLTPADFILYPKESKGVTDMALLQALEPQRRWRQARRLLEVRIPGLGFDFMVAAVRKRQ